MVKINTIVNIFFITSLFMFAPLLRPDIDFKVFPFEKKPVFINIQSSQITISSNSGGVTNITISRLNPQTKQYDIIKETNFIRSYDIDNIDRGYYLLEIVSQNIATITISENGIPNTTFQIIGIILLAKFVLYLKKTFISPIDLI